MPRKIFDDADRDLSNGQGVRAACRAGGFAGTTSGLAPGFVQGNLAVLPRDLAGDFLRFCQANPRPCPVIGVSEVGEASMPGLGSDIDLRTDLPAHAIRAIQITSRFPAVHGAPLHIGMPERIGIHDIDRPDYGDRNEVLDGELPVFWGCGVTPQSVIEAARLPFAITHAPGCMLVTDRRNNEFAIL